MFPLVCIVLILFALVQGGKARERLRIVEKDISEIDYILEIEQL